MDTADPGSARAALVAALDVVQASPTERFERIVRIAREVFDVPFSYVNVLDDTLLHTLTPNLEGEEVSGPLQWSFCQLTVQQPEPLVVADTLLDPRTADLPGVTRRGIRFYAGVPLTMPGGVRIGSLCLMDDRPRTFSPQDEVALIDLGRWVERALAQGLQQDRLHDVLEALRPAPVVVPGYRVGGITIPASDVAGDLYDWHLGEHGLTFTVADIMGKGRPAALLATGLRSALRQHDALDPVSAIAAVEPRVAEDLVRSESFATLFHARLTPASGRVDLVDAGHGLVLHLAADGGSRVLRSHDLPLGLHPDGVPRTSGSVVLGPGDALVVASDGALDLGNGTIDALLDLGRVFRRADSVTEFLDVVRVRAAERAEDDVTLALIARD